MIYLGHPNQFMSLFFTSIELQKQHNHFRMRIGRIHTREELLFTNENRLPETPSRLSLEERLRNDFHENELLHQV